MSISARAKLRLGGLAGRSQPIALSGRVVPGEKRALLRSRPFVF